MQQVPKVELGVIRAMRGRIAHDDELGICYSDSLNQAAHLTMPAGPQVGDGNQHVDAGAVATLLDTACGIGAMTSLGFLEVVATIDLRIDYMDRLALGPVIEARSEISHRAGTIGNGSIVMQGSVSRQSDNGVAARCVGRFTRRCLPNASLEDRMIAEGKPSGAASYTEFMGFQDGAQDSTILPYRLGLLGNGSLPSLHGGVIAALLQEAGCRYMRRHASEVLPLVTAQFNFLRFGRPADLCAVPEAMRLGRGAATIRVNAIQMTDAARPIACAMLTFAPS